MAITTIASANADPQNNPADDLILSLSNDAPMVTPQDIATQQLYGFATDSGDAGASWVYSWSILSSPPSSTAAIISATAQNVQVQNFNAWGNIRLFLVATNSNTGHSSEADPLKAPSSSFVTIRMRSPKHGIQKMAGGERNWMGAAWEWADAIENMQAGVGDHTINFHSDVNNATGADLDVLSQGGYAIDPDGSNPMNPQGFSPLHRHMGSDVDPATTSSLGTVVLADTPLDAANPLALSREYITYTASVDVISGVKGLSPYATIPMSAFLGGTVSPMIAIWACPWGGIEYYKWSVFILDGGGTSTQPFEFTLHWCSSLADVLASNWTQVQTATGTDVKMQFNQAGNNHAPIGGETIELPPWETTKRGYIGLGMAREPAGVEVAAGIRATLILKK